MQNKYEAPELTFVGEANAIVMGLGGHGVDGVLQQSASDFEFEQD